MCLYCCLHGQAVRPPFTLPLGTRHHNHPAMAEPRPGRGSAAFDAFRRELIRKCVPVQKTARTEWEAKIKEFVEAALPEPRKLFQKPGLAARMFAVEIEVPQSHPRDLEVFAQQLDLIWEAKVAQGLAEWRTLTTPDRNDVIWEFAVDTGGSYVTGCVKLRNFPFERPERREPREGRSDEERPRRPYQRRDDRPSDDRPRRPYQQRGDRPSGDRPSRPYQRRDDRPSGDRPPRPYQRRDDRPSGDRPSRPYQRRDDRPSGDRPSRPYQKRDDRPSGDRPSRPYQKRDDRPSGSRPSRPYKPRKDSGPKRPYKRKPKD